MGEGVEERRRAPEKSLLVEAFRRGWPEVSASVPRRVQREVERYQHCGDVRYGFVEVSCSTCNESRLVAFSCKGRGWCPSCTTRRAVETGVELESLLPRVPYRQWTLSLPYSLKLVVVKQPQRLKRLEVLLVRAVWNWQRREAKSLGASAELQGGAVCFWQWFGSSLQLTPHLHLLVPEALWSPEAEEVSVPPPSDDVVERILQRVLRQAMKSWPEVEEGWAVDDYQELQQRAMELPIDFAQASTPRARRVAVAHGFSLHADTWVHGNDRAGLERLCAYGARGPVSEARLRRLDDGRYEYTPKKGRVFTVTAAALVRRLVALVPPAKLHLTSFHGVFAPNAALRPLVTRPAAPPPPTTQLKFRFEKKPKKPRLDWATLHQRTFGTDVTRCPCGGRRSIRRLHSTRQTAEKRLLELGVRCFPSRVLPLATAPPPQLSLAF